MISGFEDVYDVLKVLTLLKCGGVAHTPVAEEKYIPECTEKNVVMSASDAAS